MPIEFEYDGLDVDLEELDELEEFVSEGDVDTDRVLEEEEGEAADLERNFERVIVVDNIPKGVPEEKQEKLAAILEKIFSQTGPLEHNGLSLPTNADKATLGWAFVAYQSVDAAQQVLKAMKDGFAFDKRHTLKVFPFADLRKYSNWPDKYEEPQVPAYEEGVELNSWLLDPALRDQYLLRHSDKTEIFWCEGAVMNAQGTLVYDGARERENGKIWCEMYTAWSPKGSYLATFHRPGIALWGGDKFEKIGRVAHMDVQHILFSPNERFLFTWNGKDDNRDPRALICWDVKTGREMRSFKVTKQPNGEPAEWPIMKWSPDDKYFARQTTNGISVFDTESFKLMEKKPVKAKGVVHFEWSKSDPIIAYWAPEEDKMPARVVLLDPATRTELRSKNLFNVREVKLHWQNNGDFLCAQVLRHSKTGKTTFTNFEIFRMRDANFPNEILEMKDMIEGFAWEPSRERFGVIHGENQHRLCVSFYTMGAIEGGSKIEKLYTLENKQVSDLHWSPAGNMVIMAGKSINGNIEFWDVDEAVQTAEEEHFMCNEVSWDPSGRIVATVVTQPMFGTVPMRYQLENGYNLWSFQGENLRKEQMEHFYQFAWRPRPATTLSTKEIQKVEKNLKTYMARYSKDDEIRRKRLEASANKEKIESLTFFRDLFAARSVKAAEEQQERIRLGLDIAVDEGEFEVMDELEEHFVSEKVEPYFG